MGVRTYVCLTIVALLHNPCPMVANELDLTSISRVWWQSLRPDLCGPPRPIRTGTRFLFCAILFLLYPCAPPSCVVYCYLWLFYHIQLEPQKKQTGTGELERGSLPKPGWSWDGKRQKGKMRNTSPKTCEHGTCLNLLAIERCNLGTLFHHSCQDGKWTGPSCQVPCRGEMIWPGAQKHIFSREMFFCKCGPQMDCWKMKAPQATTAKPPKQPFNLNLL